LERLLGGFFNWLGPGIRNFKGRAKGRKVGEIRRLIPIITRIIAIIF